VAMAEQMFDVVLRREELFQVVMLIMPTYINVQRRRLVKRRFVFRES
jgi:hypothetical protein